MATFLKATGIPAKQILGKHWATWYEPLTDAGIVTASFKKPRTPEESVFEAFAQLLVRLGKWPTENELLLERRRDSSFPSSNVIRRMRRADDFRFKLLHHRADRLDLAPARAVATQQPIPEHDASTSIGRVAVQGYVHMMRSGRRYKIGHTTSPVRHHREVRLELRDPTYLVHSIATDDPAGIEAY